MCHVYVNNPNDLKLKDISVILESSFTSPNTTNTKYNTTALKFLMCFLPWQGVPVIGRL